MTRTEEFEHLRKDYILQTEAHLKSLEKLNADDLYNTKLIGEMALRQAESATSFMRLCLFINAVRKL